jgi:redox-regulated HSP33 family molecular chaperone
MFRGNGPIGQITAVADGQGQVRGFVGNPTANPDLKNGKVRIYSILVLKYLPFVHVNQGLDWPSKK